MNFEINGFTRIVWKNQKDQDFWNDKLVKATNAYNITEYEMVKRGIRKACTIHLDIENLKVILDKLRKDGLIFTPIARSAYYEGFSHKHITPRPGQPSFWYGCVTKTQEDATIFAESSSKNINKEVHPPIGELLGYPKCCSKVFTDLWETGNYDPMFEIAKNTKDSEIEETDKEIVCTVDNLGKYSLISPLLRYFGMRVISHFPCSLKCEESYKVAKKWEEVMRTINDDATNWLLELLNKIESWDSLNGVVEVQTPYFIGITHTYPYLGKNRVIRFT